MPISPSVVYDLTVPLGVRPQLVERVLAGKDVRPSIIERFVKEAMTQGPPVIPGCYPADMVFVPRYWKLNYARYCEEPHWLDFCGLLGARYEGFGEYFREAVSVAVPCRRCPTCLRIKRSHWRERAMVECGRSMRTWFGTLTFSPACAFQLVCAARQWAFIRREDYDAYTERKRFTAMAREGGKLVTKWIKRVRKAVSQSGSFRYLLVVERHTGFGPHHGYPHFHLLVHEPIFGARYTERLLRDRWDHGQITQFKLVDVEDKQRSVNYVCKYITKDAETRVRASQRYGLTASENA